MYRLSGGHLREAEFYHDRLTAEWRIEDLARQKRFCDLWSWAPGGWVYVAPRGYAAVQGISANESRIQGGKHTSRKPTLEEWDKGKKLGDL